MPTFNSRNATCRVFTQKEGVLSAIAHDLEIDVTTFVVEINGSCIGVRVDANSLRVLHALKGGVVTDALSDMDKREIQQNLVKDVLHAERFPVIGFVSKVISENDAGLQITGDLELHGTIKEVEVEVRKSEGKYIVELPIHQPDFGMKPYTAMLGTLKVKADVMVRLSVPVW